MQTSDISIQYVEHMGSDLSVVNAARVSFENTSTWEEIQEFLGEDDEIGKTRKVLSERDKKLINYLAKHKHTSPFNHAFVTFRVKAPIIVARQLVKHKFMPWNEVSRRYVSGEPEFFFPKLWRRRADNVKQGSSDEGVLDQASCTRVSREAAMACLQAYEDLLTLNVCPEQARMVLPQNMQTQWIWSGSLGAIADMCRLRLDGHAQFESQMVARPINWVMQDLFPQSWKALLNADTTR